MGVPTIKHGRLTTGTDVEFGDNVVIDVEEEVVLGDRCTIGDGAVLSGRRVELGSDFFGYSWGHPLGYVNHSQYRELTVPSRWLDVGRGRRDDEDAVLKVGSRVTMHDNKIDLARSVMIGDDVGLSPEVAIYTHGYWQSPLDGFPMRREGVMVGSGSIVGFRSALMPGSVVPPFSVVGAQSVWTGGDRNGPERCVWAGNPAKLVRSVSPRTLSERNCFMVEFAKEYARSREHRGLPEHKMRFMSGESQRWEFKSFGFFLAPPAMEGGSTEDEDTDDLRWFLFCRGIRLYTKRRFRKLSRSK